MRQVIGPAVPQELLHVAILRPQPDGTDKRVAATKPSTGQNHVTRLFRLLDHLFSRGHTPESLAGAVFETYTNGKRDVRAELNLNELRMLWERRERSLIS